MSVYRKFIAPGRGRPFGPFDLARAALALGALMAVAHYLPRFVGGQTVTGEAVVIDGDSLRLDGRELRLDGVDAPELQQTCERNGRSYACGRLARRALGSWLARGKLVCRVAGADRYGRDLALCAVDGEDVNAALVREGVAVAYGRYEREEAAARTDRRGLWAGSFEPPADWRRRHPRPDEKG